MAISIQNLSQLITEFRNLAAKDSVSPESLGYLLQRIVDLIEEVSLSASVPSSGNDGSSDVSTAQYLATLNELRAAIEAKAAKTDAVYLEGTEFVHNDNGTLYMRLGKDGGKYKGIDCPMAQQSKSGFMRAEDKAKLDSLPSASELAEQLAAAGAISEEAVIAFEDLDTMGQGDDPSAIDNLAEQLTRTRFYVTGPGDGHVIGTLDVFCDAMLHVLTQVLTTHAILNADGNFDGYSHNCTTVRQYFRSYNIASPHLSNEEGTWSPWQELTPSALAELAQRVPTAQSTEFGTASNFIYSGNRDAQKVMVIRNTDFVQNGGKLKLNRGFWNPSEDNTNNQYPCVVPTEPPRLMEP